MNYQFSSYSLALISATVVGPIIAVILFRRRAAPGAIYLALLELAAAEWSLAAALEAAAIGVPLKLLWGKIGYLGIASGPLLYFFFTFEYSQQDKRLSPRTVALLSIFPALTVVIAATNDLHHWLWTDISIDPDTNIAIYGHGAWFWAFVAYVYTLLSIGVISLYRSMFRFPAFYRSQTGALLVGSLLPLVGNIIYVSGLNPIPGLDWTPITFTLTGIILAWSVLRLHAFDLIPIARNQLVESMVDGILVLDAQNRIVDINPEAQRLLAGTDSSLIGQPAQQALSAWPDLAKHDGSEPASVEISLGDTDQRFIDVRVSPLHDQRGRRVGRLVVLRDVTQRKQAEEALRELGDSLEAQVTARTAEIRAEKEKSEAILRSVGDGIAMTDLEMRIHFVNAAFTALTGYTAEEVGGRRLSFALGEKVPEVDWQSIRLSLAQDGAWHGEVVAQRKDGRLYDAALTLAPLHNTAGDLVGYVSSHRDISQLKELERARSQFISNVSHQLRTPVTTIQLYAHLLKDEEMSDRARQYAQAVKAESNRLVGLIEDVIVMATLDSGQILAVWKPVSMPALVESVLGLYQEQAQTSGLTLEAAPLPPDLPAVNGDQARLAQALGEVVENAVTFTPPGGQVKLSAATVVDEGCTWVTISVQDTGPGIPPEEKEKIFNRFFRGSIVESGHIPGTGLGLNIAQEIVHAHGGRVTVTSEEAKGSTFTFWLRGDRSVTD